MFEGQRLSKGVATLLMLACCTLAMVQCKSLSKDGSAPLAQSDPESNAGGLDVNDVSILFPLPSDPADISKMLPLTFANNQGKTPISAALFAEILGFHKREITVDGKRTVLKSGSRFDGKARASFVSTRVFGPYDNSEDWKIVAMRFDPCAPSATHSIKTTGPKQSSSIVGNKECLRQLRLTAQPVFDKSREESDFDGPIMVGDFALHLLFTLSESESAAIYKSLMDFRDECKDMTSAMPLGIHPCLRLASVTGQYGEGAFKTVQSLIKNYAQNLQGVAMLATLSGDDPWTFMNGLIKDGHFQQMVIDAVKKDDPKELKRGKNGNIIEPFLNGYFQQLSFLSVPASDDPFFTAIPASQRLAPPANPAKVKFSFTDAQFDAPPNFLVDRMKAKNQLAFFSTVNVIENPLQADFFTHDCASCHMASAVVFQNIRDGLLLKGGKELPGQSEYSYRLFKDRDFIDRSIRVVDRRLFDADSFSVGPEYITGVDAFTLPRGSSRPTTLQHFGYRGAKAQVSQRTANESALVAKQANELYFSSRAPNNSCPRKELIQCINSPEMPFAFSKSPDKLLSYCLN